MILANYTQENRNTYRTWGAAFTNPLGGLRAPIYLNIYTPDTALSGLALSGFPHGYNTEKSYSLPIKSGGIAATGLSGTATLAAAALAVKLATADLTGGGALTAIGSLIVQAVASINGTGTISNADLQAFLQAVAGLTGAGTVSATATGSGALSGALTGAGTSGASVLTGAGAMAADLVVTGTGLTTANVGDAVWSALATANNATGTMGEKLNDAGSAGNPWATVIEGSYTAEQMLRLVAAALLGKATATGSTYTVRDLQDTVDRIIADVDSNGNRSTVTLDPT